MMQPTPNETRTHTDELVDIREVDCGFKTSESPALRGFVGGPRALATAALYLVLKSNGYNHPENQLKKFGFSLKITYANIVKKLSAHSLLKSVFFHIFNFAHKCLTFAYTHESRYTLGSLRKIAHSGLHAERGGRFGWGRYYYPRSVPHVSETLRGRGLKRQTLPLLSLGRRCSRRMQRACGTAMRLCASLLRGVAAPLGRVIFFASAEIAVSTPCAQGLSVCARRGVVSLPSARFTCC